MVFFKASHLFFLPRFWNGCEDWFGYHRLSFLKGLPFPPGLDYFNLLMYTSPSPGGSRSFSSPSPRHSVIQPMADGVEGLPEQLSSQIEYNNKLLEQLRSVEEQNMKAQQALQEKQATLRKLLSENETLRKESVDMRRKLQVMESQLIRVNDENRSLQLDHAKISKEFEQEGSKLRTSVQKLTEENTTLRQQNSQLKDQVCASTVRLCQSSAGCR